MKYTLKKLSSSYGDITADMCFPPSYVETTKAPTFFSIFKTFNLLIKSFFFFLALTIYQALFQELDENQ